MAFFMSGGGSDDELEDIFTDVTGGGGQDPAQQSLEEEKKKAEAEIKDQEQKQLPDEGVVADIEDEQQEQVESEEEVEKQRDAAEKTAQHEEELQNRQQNQESAQNLNEATVQKAAGSVEKSSTGNAGLDAQLSEIAQVMAGAEVKIAEAGKSKSAGASINAMEKKEGQVQEKGDGDEGKEDGGAAR